MQILIVEDKYKLARILGRSLSENGYVIDIAADGEAALYKLCYNYHYVSLCSNID